MKGHSNKTNKARSLTGQKLKNTPNPEKVKVFKCPSWMPPLGRKWWGEVAPILLKLDVLTELDKGSFEATALAYSLMRKASEELIADGFTVQSDRGSKKHPALSAYKINMEIFMKGCDRFGLDPQARQRMDISFPTKEKSQQEQYNERFRVIR